MLKNYFKIAWRNLTKNKLYSLVNIGGLTIGLACCLLIGLYLANECSYDRFHKNADRLVRVVTEYSVGGTVLGCANAGSMAAPRLASGFPQIESYVRIFRFDPPVVQYGGRMFNERRFLYADSGFFSVFSFPLVAGNARDALNAPRKVVISRAMEKKYFGDQPALGKILRIGGATDYIVSGVALDPPANSQIQFDFVASFASLPVAKTPSWEHLMYTTYFLLHTDKDIHALEKSIPGLMKGQKDLGRQSGSDYMIFHLEPMTRVHLYSSLEGLEPNGNITNIYILGAIALLILCIASFNYTNLATAQSAGRTAEIGIRKVLGSAKWQLFWQFIGESLLLNGLALILAICTAILLLPVFNRLVERPLDAARLASPLALGMTGLLYLLISFTSGAYPAFILSNIKLIKVLKAGFSFSGKTGALRKSLIVFQFMVSVFLIIATTIIFQQLSYIRNKDLGYDKDHIVVLPVDDIMRPAYQSIKEAIQRVPDIQSVSCGTEEPTDIHWDDDIKTTRDATTDALSVHAMPADIDFVKTMGLHIVSGNDFTRSDWMQMDTARNSSGWHTSFLLNESAAKALGWRPEEAIGRTLYRNTQKGVVKGVVKDFHFAPLHAPITPLVIFLDSQYFHICQAFVKISGKNIPSTLQAMAATWKTYVPHRPFQYHFLDDNYNTLYHSEQQTARICSSFSILAILLACLGLFALTAYTTIQRAREIGVRKVLGASAFQIVTLLAKDFIRLVLLASGIAFPVAWLAMNGWLRNFAYRIDISWWVFLAAGLSVAIIALLSVSLQAVRAASANPVKSLKTE